MSSYQDMITAAKGDPNIPSQEGDGPVKGILAEAPTREAPRSLSQGTVAGLEGMVQAVAKEDVEEPEADTPDEDEDQFSLNDLLSDDPLRSPERRKAIEERVSDINLTDLFTKREIRQLVEIVPDRLSVTFRTLEAQEDLLIKKLLFKDEGSDQYFADRYALMLLCAGTVAVNEEVMPSHMGEKSKVDEAMFTKKLTIFERLPVQLLADLIVNYTWFDERVKRLFTEDNLKNG